MNIYVNGKKSALAWNDLQAGIWNHIVMTHNFVTETNRALYATNKLRRFLHAQKVHARKIAKKGRRK